MSSYVQIYAQLMKKNNRQIPMRDITWSEKGKQNIQAKEVYYLDKITSQFLLKIVALKQNKN